MRESFIKNLPIKWNRVYQVPEFVYFNHSIHVNKGVGCVTCHGKVGEMAAIEKATPLTMSWCLECHRRPEQTSARSTRSRTWTGSPRATPMRPGGCWRQEQRPHAHELHDVPQVMTP